MPPRLNKRQQREQEELMMLNAAGADNTGEEVAEDEDVQPPKPALSMGFAALISEDVGGDDSEEEASKPTKNKKKKKKKTGTTSTPVETAATSAPSPLKETSASAIKSSVEESAAKKEKKAAKKARAKEKRDDRDDLDKALAELSVKYPELAEIAATPAATSAVLARSSQTLTSLLSISSQNLDPDSELKKFFGSKVIAASKPGSGSSGSSSRRGQAGAAQRSVLAKPKQGWWPAEMREGLSLRIMTPDEVREKRNRHGWNAIDERWWTVEYSKKYKSVTMAFMRTVMSGDPEGFYNLLKLHPYHADTLLQLSEGYRYREEHSTAMDMIDRSLFAYERAFVGASNMTAGVTRLDFDAVESRPFFIALHRQVIDLQRRGCFRTALEFGKLLFSLDPFTDPHGALFHLDYLAIKTGLHEWLLDVWNFHAEQAPEAKDDAPYKGRINVTALPGWCFARALALHAKETTDKKGHEESTVILRQAIIAFPTIVPLLAEKADISLPQEARSHRAFRIFTDASSFSTNSESVLHILSHLYAQRSAPLWKVGDKGTWLLQTVTSALGDLPSSPTTSNDLFTQLFNIPSLAYSVYRHLSVQETSFRPLLSFIPRSVTSVSSFSGDPLPPPTQVSSYDDDFFRGVENPLAFRAPRNARDEQRMLARLVPDVHLRGQLQDFFNAHPLFAAGFPGGVTQFVQVVAQMEEGELNALLVEAAEAEAAARAARAAREGAMPGGLPGMEDEIGEWEVNFGPPPPQPPPEGNPPAGDAAGAEVDPERVEAERGEEDEDEEDVEEEVPVMPVRILRNVLNRFWGGGAAASDDSSDEENDQPLLDEHGVD